MYSDEDGFTCVSKKNNGNRKSSPRHSKSPSKANLPAMKEPQTESDDELEQLTDQQLEKIVKFYETKATKFMQSNYFQSFKRLFCQLMQSDSEEKEEGRKDGSIAGQPMKEKSARNSAKATDQPDRPRFDQVICYGLGSFNKETISRKQLYFLICLKQFVNCADWQAYDPVFNGDEQSILCKLGFSLIQQNEYCRRPIQVDGTVKRTLFYMPHCHKFMFNNLFWSNWNAQSLSDLYLIGNSFNLISVVLAEKGDPKEFAYLHELMKLNVVHEHPIENCYSNKHLFNDLSFHRFATGHLQPNDLSRLFDPQFPVYKDDVDIAF